MGGASRGFSQLHIRAVWGAERQSLYPRAQISSRVPRPSSSATPESSAALYLLSATHPPPGPLCPMKLAAMIKKMCPSDSELSIPAKNCYRMVILGSSKVGKTAIVSRFLTGRFEDAYTPTIEDFHRKFYSIRGEVYQLDILDTSGNHPFPAMRRLSILTDPRHQVLSQEQNQRECGRPAGHLR
ncbi:dexamethasone-induced Ras-related protein 1 isoform X2 [Arvicanthis niloticus]|uniref:dexamethasone-induced Ras-related protein 1 isoform X2 n=1 Tax=Arvicanthis niloticus TaxID=61156 RepID=UPI00402BEEC2